MIWDDTEDGSTDSDGGGGGNLSPLLARDISFDKFGDHRMDDKSGRFSFRKQKKEEEERKEEEKKKLNDRRDASGSNGSSGADGGPGKAVSQGKGSGRISEGRSGSTSPAVSDPPHPKRTGGDNVNNNNNNNNDHDDDDDDENTKAETSLPSTSSSVRYFSAMDGSALSIRCRKCGEVGHEAKFCTNAPILKTCYKCGVAGHTARSCPNGICYNCGKPGHLAAHCVNRRATRLFCKYCQREGHLSALCPDILMSSASAAKRSRKQGGGDKDGKDRVYDGVGVDGKGGGGGGGEGAQKAKDVERAKETAQSDLENDLSLLRCMSCGQRGHVNCRFTWPALRMSVYCCGCGQKGHLIRDCPSTRNGRGGGGIVSLQSFVFFIFVWDEWRDLPFSGKKRKRTWSRKRQREKREGRGKRERKRGWRAVSPMFQVW